MEKGFNDFYQELYYYHVGTFKPDQKEKELLAKSVECYRCNQTRIFSEYELVVHLILLWQIIFVFSISNLNISNSFHFCPVMIFKRIPNGTPMLSSKFGFVFI